MTTCTCRERVDAALAPHNTKIKVVYAIDSGRLGIPWPIETAQIETGRGKPKAMGLFASFCPFCGASLKAPEPAEVQHG